MIYIIISLLFITLALTGIMLYALERSKVKKQPTYLQVTTTEEVLERLRHITQE